MRERQDLAGAVRQTYQDWYGSHNQVTTRPYAGIPEMLAALKAQGIRLAVLSNKPHADTVHVVAHYFPDVVFDQVRGQQEGIPVKPDPTGALAIAQAMGVLWGFRKEAELRESGAEAVLHHPMELMDLLK